MKTIDSVIFRGTPWPWSLLIMFFTWHWSSHVMLRVSDGEVIDARGTGVDKREYKKPWYAWQVETPLDFLSLAVRRQMYQRAVARKDKVGGYDWRYFIAYLLNLPSYAIDSRDVCFEYVYFVVRPWIRITKNPNRVVGRHLYKTLKAARKKVMKNEQKN